MSYVDNRYLHSELTDKIIASAYEVHRELGAGFLEKVYENALLIELQTQGLKVKRQEPLNVYYKNKIIGDYYADLIIENKVIIELKAVKEINKIHEVQLVNYLKATGKQVGLILNFGRSVEVRRKILTQNNKT